MEIGQSLSVNKALGHQVDKYLTGGGSVTSPVELMVESNVIVIIYSHIVVDESSARTFLSLWCLSKRISSRGDSGTFFFFSRCWPVVTILVGVASMGSVYDS